jgi:putative ABC transport system substrate-binding protein
LCMLRPDRPCRRAGAQVDFPFPGVTVSINRRHLLGLAAASVTVPRFALAQTPQRLVASLIGAADPPNETSLLWADAVRRGLAAQGWIDGGNMRLVVRFTAGLAELTDRYADELTAMGPDIFVTGTHQNATAVLERAPDTPCVFVAVPDPVGVGLVDTYARPGGNATGIAHLEPSVGGKMVELLLQIAPTIRRAVSLTRPDTVADARLVTFIRDASVALGLGFETVDVHSVEDVAPAVDAIASEPGAGLVLPTNNWVHNNESVFVNAINARFLPAIYPATRMVDAGGLVGIGTDTAELFRLGGTYAGRILNGDSPADLPVRSAPFQLVVNLRTAAAQGITMPLSVLVIADRIIE